MWRPKYEQRIAPDAREAKEQSERGQRTEQESDMESSILISMDLKFLEVFLDAIFMFL